MKENDKAAALLGFAVKAGKIVYGIDNIVKKRVRLIILSSAARPNLIKNIKHHAFINKIDLVQSHIPLDSILLTTNCNVLGLKDKQMSEAIIKLLTNNQSKFIRIDTEVSN